MSALSASASSGVLVRADQGELLEFPGGSSIRLIADGAATHGQLSIHHTTLAAGAHGANPHHHNALVELLYVVRGTAKILVDDQVIEANQGDVAVAPPGSVHAFAAPPDTTTELLVIQTPCTDRFDLFRQMTRAATGDKRHASVTGNSRHDTYPDDSTAWQRAFPTTPTKDTP